MCDRHDPKPVWLLQIYNSERESFYFPTAAFEPAGLAQFRAALNFGQRCFDRVEKSTAQSWIPVFVEFRRLDQLTCGEPMINDGLHSMRGGPVSLLVRQESPFPRRTRFA